MRIAVDLDEVLFPFIDNLVKYVNHVRGSSHTPKELSSYYLWETPLFDSKEEVIAVVFDFWNSDFSKNIRPIFGSVKGVDHLHRKNELVVVTSRQSELENITNKWIEKYFSGKFEGVYFGNHLQRDNREERSKGGICLSLGVNAIIEDNANYVNECARLGIKGYLISNPWNVNKKLERNVRRVDSWREIVNVI